MFEGKSFTPDTDIKDLDGKVILVTGGNTGLGREAIHQLAKHDPSHIYLAARTPSKGEAAVAEIKKAVPTANISFLHLDLASFSSISTAAKVFTSQSNRLDILMNNAGIMATPVGTTEDGYEIQFGTNHMGHALLTKLLLPTLLSTAKEPGSEVRIVNLTSEGHRLAPTGGCPLEKSKLDELGPWARYGHSKLANILFTKELASRYPNITSVALHPGIIKTDLYAPNQNSSMIMRYGMMAIGRFMKTASTGAYNQLWAAASAPKPDIRSGAYYTPVGVLSKPSRYGRDDKMAQGLWEWTEKELGSKGY